MVASKHKENMPLEEAAEENKETEVKNSINIGKNPWKVTAVILGVAVIVLLMFMFRGGITGNVISQSVAGQKIIDFAKERGVNATLVNVSDKGSMYEVVLSIKGQELPLYITKDGEYLIQAPMPLTGQATNTQTQTQETPKDVPKSDEPKVELFVMTYCPYGTQAEKGLIPVLELLKGKIDGNIRFVHYFMHGDKEEQETYRQLCIREEQSSKYLTYLNCFLEAGDSDSCLTKAAIDKAKLNSCMTNKAKDYYAKDSELSQNYGVQGSPTLIINGVEASSGRDSASYLTTICSAFNKSPSECSQKLSTQSPSPGFGTSASSGGSNGGSCG